MTRSYGVFCDLRLNKRLSKQSWGWWFETSSRPLWRHRNAPNTTGHFEAQAVCMNRGYAVGCRYHTVQYTVRSRYIAVILLWRFHERHPIARPWGRDIGCCSWMQNLAEVVSLWLLPCVYYRVIDDCDISRVYNIMILHRALPLQQQSMNRTLHPQKNSSCIVPRRSDGASFLSSLKKRHCEL